MKINKPKIAYPRQLLKPVNTFLNDQLKALKKRKKEVGRSDPFKNSNRVDDNAVDTDAEEQDSHARASAIKQEIDKKIIQTRRALTRVKLGKYGVCESCSKMIDTDRLMIYPEATLCTSCAAKLESKTKQI